MVCKWIKTEEFNFDKETEFECFIFMEGRVLKVKYFINTFSFNYGFCGRKVPTHVMKISTPKEPKI